MLVKENLLRQEMAEKILSWRHTGFNAHAKTRIQPQDQTGIRSLAEYIVRCPVSEAKIILSPDGDKIIYRERPNSALSSNFQSFDALEFLAALSTHIPSRYSRMVLYYGHYSQAARGKRKRDRRADADNAGQETFYRLEQDDSPALRRRWSQLIKQVYADPLICPRCSGRMRIVAFIQNEDVIKHILSHLGLLDPPTQHVHGPPPSPQDKVSYEPFFDDLLPSEQLELIEKMN